MSNLSINGIIEARKNALLRQWAADPLVQVQAESPSVLGRLTNLSDENPGVASQLGRFGTGNVVVVESHGSSDPNRSSVWVRSKDYQGYANAYRRFLSETYNVTVSNNAIPGYQVDHLLNRARSPSAGTFVRIEAVKTDVNQRWGVLFEKVSSDPRFFANQERERRTMSWAIAAKVAGLLPPNGKDDMQGVTRIANGLAHYGLNVKEAEDGLRSMLDFAYGLK